MQTKLISFCESALGAVVRIGAGFFVIQVIMNRFGTTDVSIMQTFISTSIIFTMTVVTVYYLRRYFDKVGAVQTKWRSFVEDMYQTGFKFIIGLTVMWGIMNNFTSAVIPFGENIIMTFLTLVIVSFVGYFIRRAFNKYSI